MNNPSSSAKVRALLEHEATGQAVRFILVGSFNLALSQVILYVASGLLFGVVHDGTLRLAAANTIAFVISVTIAFLLNSRFTFRGRHARLQEYVRYGLVNIVGFGIGTAVLLLVTHAIAAIRHESLNQLHADFRMAEVLAGLCSAFFCFLWNFPMSRYWVFRHVSPPLDTPGL